jgi:hypothetical protein
MMMRTRNGLPKYCSWNLDRANGKRRVRFRKGGFSTAYRQHAAALNGVKEQATTIGAARTGPGAVEKATAIAQQLPTSYLVKQDVCGVPLDVRRLTVAVYERFAESAIGRGLLGRADRDNPWAVVSALFAGMFDDHTIEWLNKRGYLSWDQRGQAEAIIAAVNAVIGRQR